MDPNLGRISVAFMLLLRLHFAISSEDITREYEIGQSATLLCNVSSDNSTRDNSTTWSNKTITWSKNGSLVAMFTQGYCNVTEGNQTKVSCDGDGILNITKLELSDSGTYVCDVSWNNSTITLSISVSKKDNVTESTEEPEKRLNLWMMISSVISAAAVVFAIILVIIYPFRYHCQQHHDDYQVKACDDPKQLEDISTSMKGGMQEGCSYINTDDDQIQNDYRTHSNKNNDSKAPDHLEHGEATIGGDTADDITSLSKTPEHTVALIGTETDGPSKLDPKLLTQTTKSRDPENAVRINQDENSPSKHVNTTNELQEVASKNTTRPTENEYVKKDMEGDVVSQEGVQSKRRGIVENVSHMLPTITTYTEIETKGHTDHALPRKTSSAKRVRVIEEPGYMVPNVCIKKHNVDGIDGAGTSGPKRGGARNPLPGTFAPGEPGTGRSDVSTNRKKVEDEAGYMVPNVCPKKVVSGHGDGHSQSAESFYSVPRVHSFISRRTPLDVDEAGYSIPDISIGRPLELNTSTMETKMSGQIYQNTACTEEKLETTGSESSKPTVATKQKKNSPGKMKTKKKDVASCTILPKREDPIYVNY